MQALVLILSIVLNLGLYAAGAGLGGWHPVQTMLVLGVVNFAAILCHELGHAWGYWHVGGSVSRIVVLFASYDVQRRRLSRSRLPSGGDIGGYVAGRFAPGGPTIRESILVSGAGPVANLITGAIAGLAAWLWVEPQIVIAAADNAAISGTQVSISLAALDSYVRALWWWRQGHTGLVIFAVLSVGLALLNLLPYGGSDGQHIAHALKLRRTLRGR